MIEISKCKDPCFAQMHNGCKVLTTECEGKRKCPFFKPEGCEDWIRVERNGKVWLVPPEEYYEV
jgi:hypothetical protein